VRDNIALQNELYHMLNELKAGGVIYRLTTSGDRYEIVDETSDPDHEFKERVYAAIDTGDPQAARRATVEWMALRTDEEIQAMVCTWHLALGTWHLALGTWHLALGTRLAVGDACRSQAPEAARLCGEVGNFERHRPELGFVTAPLKALRAPGWTNPAYRAPLLGS
jgi:hypothetical protein